MLVAVYLALFSLTFINALPQSNFNNSNLIYILIKLLFYKEIIVLAKMEEIA